MSNYHSDLPIAFSTLVECARHRAHHQADQRGYTFLVDGERDEQHLTYAALDQQARAIAAQLAPLAAPGARALLLYPPGLAYIAAFFGCLYAGLVAVPAYPPNPAQLARTLPRLQALLHDARPALALTTAPILPLATSLLAADPRGAALHWLATDTLPLDRAAAWQPPALDGATLAFLQYTSGSTAQPKGVMLSHAHLLHNAALIQHAFGHSPASQGVIWLPPYHDMGLIGGILQPLVAGFPVTLLSPLAFLQRPLRWLEAISRSGATTSGGPNFAYDLCVRKSTPAQRAALDLRSWTLAFNGAEPIRADTLARFTAAFGPCGFRSTAFYPCYGLAEATLIVSGGRRDAPPVVAHLGASALERHQVVASAPEAADARVLVGCGQALADQRILIVDPTTRTACAPDTVGELWLAGPSVAAGYWQRADETAQTFGGTLADGDAGPFLRTGDLGFVRAGELFITGRLKDLIIIRGRNHYPQDIEATVERSHPTLRPGCGAAFGVEVDGDERLVVVQEVARQDAPHDLAGLVGAIRQAVAAAHEVQVETVVLLTAGSIPKTSSGKIQRQACRAAWVAGELALIGSSTLAAGEVAPEALPELTRAALLGADAATSEQQLVAYLRGVVAQVLQRERAAVAAQQPISALGLDSLLAVELQHRLESALGVVVPLSSLLQGHSITQLARDILPQLTAPPAPDVPPPPGASLPAGAAAALATYPLSHGQQGLWFLHQLAPESATDTIASAVRLRGDLDVAALRRAFQALLARHAALHTTFPTVAGAPVQQVHPHAALHFAEQDASAWSTTVLDATLLAAAAQPFDLAHGPLLRLSLFRRAPHEHLLLLVVHHIVVDLWSLALLIHELSLLYPAARAGRALSLPPLDVHYTDYVRGQQALLAGADGARLWEYWQRQLAGVTPVLELPTDHVRPASQTARGAAQAFALDPPLTAALTALAQRNGTTLFTSLLTAFTVLLARYSGQRELLVGVPSSGRERAAWAGVVGYFVNPLVLRVDVGGNPPFAVLLGQVRDTLQAALAHQAYPFALLVERVQPTRDASRAPLVQVLCVLQQAPLRAGAEVAAFALGEQGAQLQLDGLEVEALALTQRVAHGDLTLMLAAGEGGLRGSWQYNADLFEAATIARMVGQYQTLLAGVVAAPERRLAELPLLTEAERQQLLGTWTATRAAYPRARGVQALIAAQAARTPDALAVICGEAGLTYQELQRRANQLAHTLQRLGVGPEVRVAVCVERSLAMLIGILGILTAGGAYVPLDPAYPRARLAYMLADSQARVLLTQAALRAQLPAQSAPVVCLDADWDAISRASDAPPPNEVRAANGAYVIYTSGSTGQPKGVLVQHGGLVNLCWGLQAFFGAAGVQATGLITSISFDISVNQIFPTLCFGKTLHIITDAVKYASRALVRYLDAQGIDVLDAVPSYLSAVLRDLRAERLTVALKYILLGGEKVEPRLVQQVFAQLGTTVEIVNIYGLTEISDISLFARLTSGERGQPITVGRPLQNNRVYILSPAGAVQPIGVSGELCIAGESLARGYLNRPDLTAEKYGVCPFEDGTRMCQTGDIGRWRADGTIEVLGRMDQQVKIRGYRLEVGEVETVLAQQAGVREAVVVAREDEAGERRLVAYLVATSGAPAGLVGAVRQVLTQTLPGYMVPAAFVLLSELPHTPNGKVDRKALPAPDRARPDQAEAYAAPRNALEAEVAAIWAEMLGVEQVGIHDNFFSLGGHSLQATRLLSRLSESFQVDLPLRSFFEMPQVADLAVVIAQKQGEQLESATLAQMLAELEQLSEDEARTILAAESS